MRQDGPTNLPLFFIKEKYPLALLELEVPDGPIPSIVLRMLYCFWKSLCGYNIITVFAGAGVRVYRLLTVSSLCDKGTSVSSAFGLPTDF